MSLKSIIFFIFVVTAFAGFALSCFRLFKMLTFAKRVNRFDNIPLRLKKVLSLVFGQKKVIEETQSSHHVFIFWGFMILTIGTIEFIIRGIFPTFSYALLNETFYGILLSSQDVMAALVLLSMGYAIFRRLVIRPKHIHNLSADAFIIISMISGLMISFFFANASEILLGEQKMISYLFISNIFTSLFSEISPDGLSLLHEISWWSHAIILLSFLNYIPYSKHIHLLGAIPNIFFTHLGDTPMPKLAKIDFENTESYGVGNVFDFSWKQLLDGYACTECGRCDLYCPANNTGKPLHPQSIIHQMRDNMKTNSIALLSSRKLFDFAMASNEEKEKVSTPLLTKDYDTKWQIAEDAIWSCTTCGACMEACPVTNEHVPSILDMRRYQVMMESNLSPEGLTTLKNIENTGNPWGLGRDKREDWCKDLNIPILGKNGLKENGNSYDYLFWVGCAGAYDDRYKKVTKSFAEILLQSKVDFAILGNEESCTGDSARRLGNEYLFQAMAEQNIEIFKNYNVQKIITTCPHCFHTLKNEYPDFGGKFEVIHHTEFLQQLLKDNKVPLAKDNEKKSENIVYHDSCYIGRWNNIYDAPREVIKAVTGEEPTNPDRNKNKGFCCGAGGGRMWLEEKIGKRVNIERTEELLAKNPDTIGVNCPFCLTMMKDGIAEKGVEEKVQVKDLSEIVAEKMIRA